MELFSQLFIKDDIIFINFQEENKDTYNLIFGSTCKILVPNSLKRDIMFSAHSSKMCGHFRLKTTVSRIFERYHWRTLKADVTKFIQECILCNVSRDKPSLKHHKYSNLECQVLNKCVHLDISGKWPRDSRGYLYVLCIVEAATRYSIFIPLKQKTSKIVLEAFFSRYIAYLVFQTTYTQMLEQNFETNSLKVFALI